MIFKLALVLTVQDRTKKKDFKIYNCIYCKKNQINIFFLLGSLQKLIFSIFGTKQPYVVMLI